MFYKIIFLAIPIKASEEKKITQKQKVKILNAFKDHQKLSKLLKSSLDERRKQVKNFYKLLPIFVKPLLVKNGQY